MVPQSYVAPNGPKPLFYATDLVFAVRRPNVIIRHKVHSPYRCGFKRCNVHTLKTDEN